jgi:FtsP/CotA-like multicopper oxidase with cupredoxin domain
MLPVIKKWFISGLLIFALLAVASCGGGGGGSTEATNGTGGTGGTGGSGGSDGGGFTFIADFFGPPEPEDPSAFGPLINAENVDFEELEPANIGAFEGGPTGTEEDTAVDTVIPEDQLESTNVPTDGRPSPLFGALPFTQKMLRFEEFGPESYDPATNPQPASSFPLPSVGPAPERDPGNIARSGPDPAAIGKFLAEPGIRPLPSEFSNQTDENPWKSVIAGFLGRPLDTPPAEGRPPGRGWAHQRWNEFFPQAYFKTGLVGSRTNDGARDNRQLHGYQVGEWGPGGLYHNLYRADLPGSPSLDGTTRGLTIRFHPLMPVQDHKTLWTFDGTLPPKLLMARHGQPILMRNYNALPIDPSANRGFGLHTLSTHEHNGHSPAESDGYTNAFFFPGQYYDYRWPLQLAGYDTINTDAVDPRAAFPCSPGETLFINDADQTLKTCQEGKIPIRGDWRETMSTHWFHDHMLDYTAQNVYKGNAAMMNYYSAIDRGKEDFKDGVNLRFPSGTALDWGNRDYDVNLIVADKAWDRQGQLWFNIFNKDGFIGDQLLTNWLYKPYFEVRARRYRFRIIDGGVSRYLAIALVRERPGSVGELPGPPGSNLSYDRVPFHLIANDGNIMEHAVPFDGSMDLDGDGDLQEHNGQLPTQAIGERYDIIVDFAAHGIQPGDKLYFVNVLEHTDGQVTGDKIPLADILNENYLPVTRDNDDDGLADEWRDGDPAVGKFLQLRVAAYAGTDQSMNPADYEPGKKKMIPLKLNRDSLADQNRLASARHRTFEFGRSSGTDGKPWTIKTDGGSGFTADPRRVSAAPQLSTGPTEAGFSGDGTLEIWEIVNGGNGWSHPVHVHFEEGIILRRDDRAPPEWEKWARKDLYRIGPDEDDGRSIRIAINFREFAGTYMEHCHNTQHEDNAMLLRWDIEHPGQLELMPTPLPTWDGVEYVDSAALPTFRSGDGLGPVF